MTELIGYFEAKPAVRSAGPATFQDATVATLAPLTVTINGATEAVSAIGFAKVVGERGLVMVQGTRVEWFGGQDSPAIIQGEIDDVTQGLTDFQQDYTQDQAAAAVELGNIRDAVDVLELESVTTTRLAVLATGDGVYMDPGFLDSALTQERADNSGLSRVDNEISGPGTLFLSQRGADEGVSLPLQVDALYSVVVKGSDLTADKRVLAVKWSNGVVTNLPTVYGTSGSLTTMAASVVPTSAGARLLVRAVSGAPSMTVRSVEIRHGIGGTLIEEDSINTTHIVSDSVKARHVDTSEVYADLKITSPTIETNPAVDRGIKIIDDTLTGYSSTGEKLIEIGGPDGLIKGIRIEGSEFWADGIFMGERGGFSELELKQQGNRGILFRSNNDPVDPVGYNPPTDMRFYDSSPIPAGETERLRLSWEAITFYNSAGASPLQIKRAGDRIQIGGANVPAMVTGSTVIDTGGGSTFGDHIGTGTGTFPAGRFTAPPAVTIQGRGPSVRMPYFSAVPTTVTATTFTFKVYALAAVASTLNVTFDWIAAQS